MKAMILAAGKGERMRPLTNTTPKPLLKVNNKPLLQYHIESLRDQVGINEFIINTAYLGQKIQDYFNDGSNLNVSIKYSAEETGSLETAGGIKQALPLLGNEDFILVNGDIFTDFDFASLNQPLSQGKLAHLILVSNPEHHPQGDFAINNKTAALALNNDVRYTYSGIGRYSIELFKTVAEGKQPLGPILKKAIKNNNITGCLYSGLWSDIGTPERLSQIKILIEN